ncbi:MAG: T9SS type A sorting domain-containing protein [Flavobacteriales bacterium]|nr:T9SS type A sorting domain-containing protein [Flavobacteriales bacterium]
MKFHSKTLLQFVIAVLIVTLTTSLQAQSEHFCKNQEHLERLSKENPTEYKALLKRITDHDRESERIDLQKAVTDTTYIVPVVFHIIHNNGPEKISQAQILDAMRILNEDFNKLNADTAEVLDIFKPIISDVRYEFRLAQIDPNGNCTNGINYYESSEHYKGGNDAAMKWVQDQWTPNHWKGRFYLNIYANTGIGGGWSYGPTKLDKYSGVMVQTDFIGLVGTGVGGYNERTITHEVGHWFNLGHTWGGGGDPAVTGNCNKDDGVADTPNCGGTFSCAERNSCDDGVDDLPDNNQNYMDYACGVMFTEGQKTKMINSMLTISHRDLFDSTNLANTGTIDPYVYGSVTCYQPTVEISIPYEDLFICTGDSVTYSYFTEGAVADSVKWEFPNGSPATSTNDFPQITYSTGGKHSAYLTIYAGEYTASDSSEVSTIQLGDGEVYPYSNNFEDEVDFDDNFYISNLNGDASGWEYYNGASFSGSNCISMNNDNNIAGREDELFGPLLDLSSMEGNAAILSFQLAYAMKTGKTDRLEVYFTKNCGEKWNKFYTKSGGEIATTSNSTGSFVPTKASEWRQELIELPVPYSTVDVLFKFVFTSDQGNSLYIDDINSYSSSINKNDEINRSLSIFPNPVNPNSTISFDLPNSEEVTVEIYNLLGDKVASTSYGKLAKGSHQLNLEMGAKSQSGIYFVKVKFNNEVITRKVVKQ